MGTEWDKLIEDHRDLRELQEGLKKVVDYLNNNPIPIQKAYLPFDLVEEAVGLEEAIAMWGDTPHDELVLWESDRDGT